MIHTIRGHITLWAFAVFLGLVVLEAGLVLRGLDAALDEVADQGLLEELDALTSEVADTGLNELLRSANESRGHVGDLVFEIRDALAAQTRADVRGGELLYVVRRDSGPLLGSSESLRGLELGRTGARVLRHGVAFRDEPDPRGGGGRLRVAELALGPYRVELARSLAPFAAITRAIRAQLAAILAGVTAIAALGAYAIATRALSPVRRLIEESKRLRTLSEGSLPRTGRGDEIDDLAAVLNGLLERIRADVLRIRQFTADAAHEIRTPLAAIRGHLELLMGDADPPAQHTLAGVLEEVERLTRLVNQLLLLEKLQEGGAEAPRRSVDLAELARELADHLGVVAEDQGLELVCDLSAARVSGDPEKLRQVFLNLIDNAFKHSSPGGRVTLRVFRDGAAVRAVVRDTGPGIPPEDFERVFERFWSDRSRRGAGTGLGLPIARAIARAHGGELVAASPGGAEFTLTLPAEPPPA